MRRKVRSNGIESIPFHRLFLASVHLNKSEFTPGLVLLIFFPNQSEILCKHISGSQFLILIHLTLKYLQMLKIQLSKRKNS